MGKSLLIKFPCYTQQGSEFSDFLIRQMDYKTPQIFIPILAVCIYAFLPFHLMLNLLDFHFVRRS